MTESVKSTDSATTVKSVPSTCYEDLQKENASVLEEILALGNEVTKGDQQDLHLNVFFQMYNEVFPSAVQSRSSEMKLSGRRSETGVNNPTVVDKCIRKLREVHRRKFRGGFYQTDGRLEEINVTATAEAMKLFNKLAEKAFSTESEREESESALKDRILLERRWLEKVNDWKRQKHFDQIKIEAIESFKSAVENEFPFVDLDFDKVIVEDDNNNKDKIDTMQFYDDAKLKAQLEQSMNAVVLDYKQQIPSDEDPRLVKALELSLRNELLDGSISPVLDRNSENRIRAQDAMYALVEELTVDFKDKMTSFLQESPLLDPSQVRNHHQEIVTEYLQSIEVKAAEIAGPSEFHVHFQNTLNTKIDEIFKLVMGVAFKEAQVSVETCSNRSKECVRKCAQKVEAIFEEFGAARYSSELRDKLEACLMQAIDVVRGNTIVNVRNVEKLVESTMSKNIDTNASKAEKLAALSESVKARYKEKVEELLKLSKNSPLHKSSDFQGFQKTEDNIRNDISKLFRDEIRSQVGDDVDLDWHLNKLHQYISDYWTKALQKIVESLENATKHLPEPEQVNKEVPKNNKNKKLSKKPSKASSSTKVMVDTLKIEEVKKVIKNALQPNNKPGNNKIILADQKRPLSSAKETKKRTDTKERPQSETTFQKQHRNMSELTTTLNRVQQGTPREKESLPPIVFQMGSARIVTGVVLDFLGPRILENEFGYRYTPALVTLTKENTFVYGHAALEILNSTEGGAWQWTNLQKHWWVANHLISGESSKPWSITVPVNGEQKEITVEFLLAFIFRKLKESVQTRMFSGVQCSTAVITVPIWISSSQRVQIKEAAKIAGFSEVHLVNEAASAAYCYVNHREARDISMGNLMILSENSDRVDVSIYSYSKFGGCLKMLAHSGHYCLEDTLCPSRNTSTGRGNFALGESQENVIYWVRQACKQAVSKSKKCLRAYEMPYMKEILVVSQAPEKWADILETIGRDFGRKFGGVRQEEAVIIGACALSQRPKAIGHIIRDQVPYSLMATSGSSSKNGSVVIEADYGLPTNGKLHSVTLLGALQVNFHQSLTCTNKTVWKIPVGNLTILESPPRGSDYYFEPYLEINHEGIVTLKGVHLYCETDGKCTSVSSEKYRWKPANIDEDKRVKIVCLLEEVHSLQLLSSTILLPKKGKLSKTAQLVRAKKVLARKCREMLDLLENDSMQIKMELGKDLILRRIDEAIRYTEVTTSTMEEVEKQMEALGGIYSKYFLKHAKELRKSIVEKQLLNPTPPPELTDSDRSTDVVNDAIAAAGVSVNNNPSKMRIDLKKNITDLPVAQSKSSMIL